MAEKRWNELSQRARQLIITGGALEALLKVAALVDLAQQPANTIRGSKPRWAAAIVLINSVGAVPIAYFVYGKRKP